MPLARASTTLTVTRTYDNAFPLCSPDFETLRCAINGANVGSYNTILFSQAVTHVILVSALPTITSQGTDINGALPTGGVVVIDAAGLATGAALVISASDVLIDNLSIINVPGGYADVQITGGQRVRIGSDYLGVVRGAANCNYAGHTRNSGYGVDVATSAGNSGAGGAYIFGNFIGCHSNYGYGQDYGLGSGIRIQSSWAYVGQDYYFGIPFPNYIGVIPGSNGSTIPNDTGVAILSYGFVTATNNSVLSNTIAGNRGDGIDLMGPSTSGNLISGTVIYSNGLDGICEDHAASDNVWTHVSIYQAGGLGIRKYGDCPPQLGGITELAPPYPVVTSVDPSTHVVHGTADASADCPFHCVTVELYRVFPNPRGFGEGKTFVGATTTDSQGNWHLTDPAFSGGCYTAFETTFQFLLFGSHDYSSEFGPDNCRTWLPLVLR